MSVKEDVSNRGSGNGGTQSASTMTAMLYALWDGIY